MNYAPKLKTKYKYAFPILIGLQICLGSWLYAYADYLKDYVPDGHEEERKRIIETVEKELKNQTGSGMTGAYSGTTQGTITSNSKINQGKKGNAVIVSQKGQNSDIQSSKSSTGASADMQKTGITEKSVKEECNKECKIRVLIENGIRKEIAETLVNECSDDKCIKMGASIATAESGGGDKCFNSNCFGLGGGSIKYDSIEEGTKDFVKRYYKWWHKAKSMSFFYPPKGQISRSHYCMSEISSGSDVGCPNGLSHSQTMFNLLNKQF